MLYELCIALAGILTVAIVGCVLADCVLPKIKPLADWVEKLLDEKGEIK